VYERSGLFLIRHAGSTVVVDAGTVVTLQITGKDAVQRTVKLTLGDYI
jgi:hypothetical protein